MSTELPKIPIAGTASVEELIPYFNNPRAHSKEAVDKMCVSITDFGFRIPVLVKYSDDGPEVIDGHLRLKAAMQLGMTDVPTLDASDMTDAQVRAFRIMVNRSVEWAEWDDEKLLEEMQLIAEGEFGEADRLAALTGFGQAEVDAIFTQGEGDVDIEGEWAGMPEFEQENKHAFRSLAVHFKDQEAIDAFAKVVGHVITDKTRMMWYPEIEIETYADKEYQQEGENSEIADENLKTDAEGEEENIADETSENIEPSQEENIADETPEIEGAKQ